jgi:hypothetical protein
MSKGWKPRTLYILFPLVNFDCSFRFVLLWAVCVFMQGGLKCKFSPLSSFIAGNRKNICYIVWLTFQLANQIGTNLPLTDDVICSCQNLLYFIFAA